MRRSIKYETTVLALMVAVCLSISATYWGPGGGGGGTGDVTAAGNNVFTGINTFNGAVNLNGGVAATAAINSTSAGNFASLRGSTEIATSSTLRIKGGASSPGALFRLNGSLVEIRALASSNYGFLSSSGNSLWQTSTHDVFMNNSHYAGFDQVVLGDPSSFYISHHDADALTSGGIRMAMRSSDQTPESQIDLSGSVGLGAVARVQTDITVTAAGWWGQYSVFACDPNGGEIHFVLPDATTVDRRDIWIKQVDNGAVDIDANGTQVIDKATSINLLVDGACVHIKSYNGGWLLLSEYTP